MTLQSVLGCQVCSALEKQSVPRSKVFFGAKCASANKLHISKKNHVPEHRYLFIVLGISTFLYSVDKRGHFRVK